MRYDFTGKKPKDEGTLADVLAAIRAIKLETATIIRQQTGTNYLLNETRGILTRLEEIITRLELFVERHDKWEREQKWQDEDS